MEGEASNLALLSACFLNGMLKKAILAFFNIPLGHRVNTYPIDMRAEG